MGLDQTALRIAKTLARKERRGARTEPGAARI